LKTLARSAPRPPRDKSLGYKTAPAKAGFGTRKRAEKAQFIAGRIAPQNAMFSTIES
jgi:hypothetical protein